MDNEQIERLKLAGLTLTQDAITEYLAKPDDLGEYKEGMKLPVGYKKCGRCKHVLKLYMFNKNKSTKTYSTGNCKACQRQAAAKSYKNTKKKRQYKKYYQEHKDERQEQARQYYAENKEEMDAKHQEYLATKKGKKVMHKAQKKRRITIVNHKGIPYTRALVLDRDKRGGNVPVCYLCGEPILNTDGAHCHLDHVVSLNNGGTDCFTNIAAVHSTCNLKKEKDDRNLTSKQIQEIKDLAKKYMQEHPDKF